MNRLWAPGVQRCQKMGSAPFNAPAAVARFRLDFPESRCLQSDKSPAEGVNRFQPRETGRQRREIRYIGWAHPSRTLEPVLESGRVKNHFLCFNEILWNASEFDYLWRSF